MEYRLKNDLEQIELLAQAVELFGETHKLPAKTVFQTNLALDELLTNTICYGYPKGGEHEIMVRLTLESEKFLFIEICDDADAFNPLEIAAPDVNQDIDDRPIGGLGIFLVRRIMDEITYMRKDNHNILILRKRIGP